MKVLFIAPHLRIGGHGRQLIYLMKELHRRGIAVSLIIFDPIGLLLDEIPNGIKVHLPKPSKPKNLLKEIWKIKEILKVVYREKPDILYSRLWPTKIPTAFTGCLLRKKVVLSESNSLVSMAFKNRVRTSYYLRNISCRLADAIVAVSEGVAGDLKQLLKINSKIRVIYNGIDLEEIEKKGKEEVSHPWFNGEEPIAVSVGRLINQKGFSYLLESVKFVNKRIPLKLLIIGDGKLKEELKNQAEEFGIKDKVDFLGIKKNPFAYMARSDLFVLSSLWEGFPNVLLEAMALGLPVISTKCPHGPSEIIEDGKNGILIPFGKPQAISEAILRVLGDKQLREKLRMEAKRRAKDFSLENMASKYTELFLSLSGRI